MPVRLKVKRAMCRVIGHQWGPWSGPELDVGPVVPLPINYRVCRRCPAYETRPNREVGIDAALRG